MGTTGGVDLEIEVVEEGLMETQEDKVEMVEAQDLDKEVHLVHPNPPSSTKWKWTQWSK